MENSNKNIWIVVIAVIVVLAFYLISDMVGTATMMAPFIGLWLFIGGIIYTAYFFTDESVNFHPKNIAICVSMYLLIAISPAVIIVASTLPSLFIIDTYSVILLTLIGAGLGLVGIFYRFSWVRYIIKCIKYLNGENASGTLEFLCYYFVPFYSFYWMYSRSKKLYYAVNDEVTVTNKSVLNLILSILGLEIVALCLLQSDINKILNKDINQDNRHIDREALLAELEKRENIE